MRFRKGDHLAPDDALGGSGGHRRHRISPERDRGHVQVPRRKPARPRRYGRRLAGRVGAVAAAINIALDSELAGLLQMHGKPVGDTARELIVLELYGKAGSPAARPENCWICPASRLWNTHGNSAS